LFFWMLLLLLVDVFSGVSLVGVYAVFLSLLSGVFWLDVGFDWLVL
jgi:hypothetical protein